MHFFGITLHQGTYRDFLDTLFRVERRTLVFTPNPEILTRAYHDPSFLSILEKADYNVPDGNGLYVGSMMQEGMGYLSSCFSLITEKKKIEEKYGELIKGADLVKDILESGKDRKKKILVIDRKNAVPKNELEKKKAEVQKNLKNIIEAKYPGVELFVVFSGEKSPEEIAQLIRDESINYVFSCIGMRAQEELLVDIFSCLSEDQRVVGLGVGASIDFLLGLQKRAPAFFRDAGLEWFYRLITQPRIRARRIWTALVEFPKLIKKSSR